jgi:predicted ATPase/DNA-binding SARP family transcriptional activator
MSRLMVSLLGAPRVELDGLPMVLDTRKAVALLAYLAVVGRRQRRETLVTLLWPESDQAHARNTLRYTLSVLKKALGAERMDIGRESLGLKRDSNLWVDVDRFHSQLAAYRAHAHRESDICPDCLSGLSEAVALYQGDFLAGFTLRDSPAFDEWQFMTSEQLRSELATALEVLVRYHTAHAAWDLAIDYARRLVALDPLHEPAQRRLIQVYAWAGRRAAALRQYRECVRVLEQDLGTPPSEETNQLYEAIKASWMLPQPVQGEEQAATSTQPTSQVLTRQSPGSVKQVSRVLLHNLPDTPTPFVGREQELILIAERLASPACRLLTVTGPGGSGKTRLALEAARANLDVFPSGTYVVSLASISEPGFIVPAIANALDFTFYASADLKAQLLDYLREKQMLLLLDNFEHLLEGADTLLEILTSATRVKLLVTSRERLNVREEWLFPVQGLPFPIHDQAADQAESFSAVQLFLQCAERMWPGFAPTGEEKRHIAHICRLVEGMPLGIELAAAWVRMLTCAEIAQEIAKNLDVLSGSSRNVPSRHRSLRAAFDHSWRLLSVEEQRILRRLSVFRGGFEREAASAVVELNVADTRERLVNSESFDYAQDRFAVLNVLAALIDKSLLRRADGRYEIHELARQYAGEKLQEAGEADQAHDQHLTYFMNLAETAEQEIKGPRQKLWLDRLEREHSNIRAALAWVLETREPDPAGTSRKPQVSSVLDIGLRLAGALWWFWNLHGYVREGREWIERLLAIEAEATTAGPHRRAKALCGVGGLAWLQGDLGAAKLWLQESLALGRALGDRGNSAYVLAMLGMVALDQGEHALARSLEQESVALLREEADRWGLARSLTYLGFATSLSHDQAAACSLFEESLAISRELGDKWGIAHALDGLRWVMREQGDAERELALTTESMALYQELDERNGMAYALNGLGDLALQQGDAERAAEHYHEAMALFRTLGNRRGIAVMFLNLGEAESGRGAIAQASEYYSQSLRLFRDMGNTTWIGRCLTAMAGIDQATGHLERAAHLLGAAAMVRDSYNTGLTSGDQADYERVESLLRAGLDAAAYVGAWTQGQQMGLEQAILFALDDRAANEPLTSS